MRHYGAVINSISDKCHWCGDIRLITTNPNNKQQVQTVSTLVNATTGKLYYHVLSDKESFITDDGADLPYNIEPLEDEQIINQVIKIVKGLAVLELAKLTQ